jgi:D-alanyl-D-alanine carboxypeptidase (penicillin-binding protein 5/6)
VSTSRDQLILVQQAMTVPAFAHIVALPSATVPVAGTIANYNHQVGTNGILGVKTGSDSAAQGCWAFAVQRTIAGAQRVVYGVVLGATYTISDPVGPAISGGVSLADSASKAIRAVTVLPAGTVVARIWVPWSSRSVPVVTTRTIAGLLGPGTTVSLRASVPSPGTRFRSGQQVGTVVATGLTGVTSSPVVTQGAAGTPSFKWRLTRS